MIDYRNLDPFRLEELRDLNAKNGNYKKFRRLYSGEYKSIKNLNTGKLWNRLNFIRSHELLDSPIYKDKIYQISASLSNFEGRLLDIGFGKGNLERSLRRSNFDLFGIDISEKSVNEIRKDVKGIFKKGNILKIPFNDGFFDVVLCLDILEHISPKNTFGALKEVFRVLKKGSILILSIPMNEGLENLVKQEKVNPNAHVRTYTSNIIKTELNLSGFTVQREIYLSAYEKFYNIKKIINSFLKLKDYNLLIIIAKKK